MPKLTDTQLVILNRAAQRDDHGVAAIDKKAATKEAITALLATKHLKLVPEAGDLALWTRDEDGKPQGLVLTPKGLKALGHDTADGAADSKPASGSRRKTAAKAGTPATRTGTKLEAVITLLRRPEGATLAELMTATGWQAHSVRGVIAGAIKKKLGLTVTTERTDGTLSYRIGA